jgi:hypothetical protein
MSLIFPVSRQWYHEIMDFYSKFPFDICHSDQLVSWKPHHLSYLPAQALTMLQLVHLDIWRDWTLAVRENKEVGLILASKDLAATLLGLRKITFTFRHLGLSSTSITDKRVTPQVKEVVTETVLTLMQPFRHMRDIKIAVWSEDHFFQDQAKKFITDCFSISQ